VLYSLIRWVFSPLLSSVAFRRSSLPRSATTARIDDNPNVRSKNVSDEPNTKSESRKRKILSITPPKRHHQPRVADVSGLKPFTAAAYAARLERLQQTV
jgi:hypothetical protein